MLFLLFELGADRYALDAADIVEVLPLVRVKRVPRAPAGIAGLVNYRGAAVPVVDLAALALGRASAASLGTRLVLVRYPDTDGVVRMLGLVAEHATELLRRNPAEFVPPPVDAPAARYLGPVATDDRGVIQRVTVSALLTPDVQAALFAHPLEA
jgi:chemotaxis-related protein WspB